MTFSLNVTEVESLAILESLQSYYNKEEKNQIDREFALKLKKKLEQQINKQFKIKGEN